MTKEITIQYKPDLDSLMKVSKYILSNLPFVKFFPFIFLIVVLFNKLPQIMGLTENINSEDESIFMTLFPFIIIILAWVFIYFKTLSTMKKNILSNKRNFENQKITFTEESYIQEGDTFKIENFWNEVYQIKETRSWFLIYPIKNSAFPIIKADLSDNQYIELKELFNSLEVKKRLK